MSILPIEWLGNRVRILDQTRLPQEEVYLENLVKTFLDLVVLSIGMMPREDAEEIANTFHIAKNQEGFYQSPPENSGIFLSGACQGPRDIGSSMVDAKATAQEIVQYLGGI